MNLNPEQLNILHRVEKLLRLAGNNTSEAEASAAAAKAKELLDAYNIDSALLNRDKGGTARRDAKTKGGLYKWQRDLWRAVTETNYCVYWEIRGLTKGASYEHRLLGSEVNVLSATLLAEYLQGAVERLARDYAKRIGVNVFCKDAIAFREGATDRLTERLRVRYERDQQEAAANRPQGSNALTLIDVRDAEKEANDDYLHGAGYSQRQRERRAAWAAERAEAADKLRLWEEQNPVEAAAKKAAAKAENDKWHADYDKKERARARRAEKRGHVGPVYKDTRRSARGHEAGSEAGRDISLDRQLNVDTVARLA